MITLGILIVAIVLFAWKEAVDDDSAIDKTNKEGTKFSHYDPDRYIVAGVFTLIMAGFAKTWWALLYFPITWAVFTISFRFLLNRMRGEDWCYIAPWSNSYDRIMMMISWGELLDSRDAEVIKSQFDFGFRQSVFNAGKIAYAFEAAVLALSLITYITKTL